ncbi:MAG TPA: glycosyltransferase [Anaerolineae bacterium]|nr:glycosyltransferase [Anaerolineae bacterium]
MAYRPANFYRKKFTLSQIYGTKGFCKMADSLRISIIIPSLNSHQVAQTLDALHGQQFDLAQVEVLVVGLDKKGLVKTDDLVKFLDTKTPVSPAVARNIGIRAATGDVLCFTDADCIPKRDWLEKITKPLQNADIFVIGGGVAFVSDNYWTLCDNLGWFYPFLATSPAGIRSLLPSLNLCVRRNVIETVGLFDESYPKPAGEDSEWTTRMRLAGFTLYFEPTAVVTHSPNRSDIRALWQHGYNYGRYSIKIRPDYINFLKTPIYLRKWWLVLLLAPLMAFQTSSQIVTKNISLRYYSYTWPGIFLSKMAWCWGAAYSLYLFHK